MPDDKLPPPKKPKRWTEEMNHPKPPPKFVAPPKEGNAPASQPADSELSAGKRKSDSDIWMAAMEESQKKAANEEKPAPGQDTSHAAAIFASIAEDGPPDSTTDPQRRPGEAYDLAMARAREADLQRTLSPQSYLPAGCGIMLIVGLGTVVWMGYAMSLDPHFGERFDDHYAPGATANLLERLLRAQWGVRPGEMILAGLLILVLNRLTSLHQAIERQRPS